MAAVGTPDAGRSSRPPGQPGSSGAAWRRSSWSTWLGVVGAVVVELVRHASGSTPGCPRASPTELVRRGLGPSSACSTSCGVTLQVSLLVVVISVLIGVPAAYVLARRDFPGKRVVCLLFLLPILMPPITYGIPLATVLYKFGLRRHADRRRPGQPGAVGAVRDPDHDPVHRADRPEHRVGGADVRGAGPAQVFTAGAGAAAGAGHPGRVDPGPGPHGRHVRADLPHRRVRTRRPWSSRSTTRCPPPGSGRSSRSTPWPSSTPSTMLVLLVVALRFVNPTQLVARVKETRDD